MTVLATETFTGTDGAAWPAQWTATSQNGGSATIQSNTGRLLSGTGNYANQGANLTGVATAKVFDVTATVRLPNVGQEGYFQLMPSAAGGQGFAATDYVGAQIQTSNYQLVVIQAIAGATSQSAGIVLDAGLQTAAFKLRVRSTTDGLVQAKTWAVAGTEPATWQQSMSVTIPTGRPSVAWSNGSGTGATAATIDDVTVTDGAVTVTIPPNDGNIVYSPYNWAVTSGSAKTINAGAYLKCVITGSPTSIAATFDLSSNATPLSQIAYRIDGDPWIVTPIAATVPMTIPNNTWTKHTIEIRVKSTTEDVNRWSPQASAVVFTGFTSTPVSGVTTATQRTRRFRLLAYGDSITEGTRAWSQTATNGTDRNDAALSWAYPLGDLLGAEIGVVGFNSQGVTVAGAGGIPVLPSSFNLLWAGQARSFTPAPDLILINEGTNDGGDLTTAATGLLNSLLSATPATTKIAIVQQWNGTAHQTQWQAAISASSTPSRITYIDTTSWLSTADTADNTHPYGYINTSDLAPRLAATVGPLLAAVTKRYLNVGGTAKPIG